MVNLRTIPSVFQTDDEMDVDEDDDSEDEGNRRREGRNKVTLSVYPQAFLRDYGHIQAKGPLQLMQPVIENINSSFAKRQEQQWEDGSNDEAGLAGTNTVVSAISTQMYNDIQHKASSQAGALDVQ